MDLNKLALIILRSIAILGFAVIMILIGFAIKITPHANYQHSLKLLLLNIPFIIAIFTPVLLWIVAPTCISAFENNKTGMKAPSVLTKRDLVPVILTIISLSCISEGLIELTLSLFSHLSFAYHAQPANQFRHDTIILLIENGASQILVGFIFLGISPFLSPLLKRVVTQ